MTEVVNKPKCPLIGADRNIFNLMGLASRTLRRNHLKDQADEMIQRIRKSSSYDEALVIITEYVDPVFEEEMDE